jgi:hypothetical protein
MKNIYITKKVVEEFSINELHIDLYDEFGFSYDILDSFEEIVIKKSNYIRTDSEPINIDKLINKLQEMKSNGSSHIALEYNCGHVGYDITGYNIYKSTNEEIQKLIDEKTKELEKQIKIRKLQEEINKLSK